MKKNIKIIFLSLFFLFFLSCDAIGSLFHYYSYLEFSATGSSTIEKVEITITMNEDKAKKKEIKFEGEILPFSYFKMVDGTGTFSITVEDVTDGFATPTSRTVTAKIYVQDEETQEYKLKEIDSSTWYARATLFLY